MSLARCQCGQVLDIPGIYRSYKQPDGRCAKCNGVSGEPTVEIPKNVQTVITPPKIDNTLMPPGVHTRPKISTNIPLPIRKNGSSGTIAKAVSKYGIETLPAPKGDTYASIYVEIADGQAPDKLLAVLRSQATYYNGKNGWKRRYQYQKDNKGVRVWRVK